jgi:hypothetical protein
MSSGALRLRDREIKCARGVSVTSDKPGAAAKPRIREARLKPEFAHLYPPLEPEHWEPAAAMADRIVAWLLRQPDRGYMAPDRVLRSEHFEFRGGTEPESPDEPRSRRQHPA